MLENGKSENEVRRTMDIHGFTEKEIRSLLNGDSVGPHAIPALPLPLAPTFGLGFGFGLVP